MAERAAMRSSLGRGSRRAKGPEMQTANVAHQTCPYSKATRGNIDVAINLV